MYIRKPDNEWFTGKYYKYNPDQDKNRAEVKREIADGSFVQDDDYDDDGYNTVYESFRYKQYVDKSIRGGYAVGVKSNVNSRQIETSDEFIEFKENDRVRLLNQEDEETPYKIVEIDINRNLQKSKATLLLPGLYNEYNSTKILSLR